jgi:hypothetical protein
VLTLLPFLVALVVGSSPPPVPSLCLHDFATLTDAEARQLAGRRPPYCVRIESEPDGDPQGGWRYDCRGEGEQLRTLWLRDGDDLATEVALRGSGLLLVEPTLRRIVHAPVKEADGSILPGRVE